MQVRLGTEKDIDKLEELYNDICDYLEATINYPGWKKGIYPAREDAIQGIDEKSLFVAEEGNKIVGSIILRHRPEPAYLSAKWNKELEYDKVFVIYTFIVSPKCLKQGIGKEILEFVAEYAKSNNAESLRLDVTENNIPAIRLYEKCGFEYVNTVSLGLEEYGLNWFKLYEKLLD